MTRLESIESRIAEELKAHVALLQDPGVTTVQIVVRLFPNGLVRKSHIHVETEPKEVK